MELDALQGNSKMNNVPIQCFGEMLFKNQTSINTE
jgi:hypothetical protein